jgi:hypothetical protein
VKSLSCAPSVMMVDRIAAYNRVIHTVRE